MTSCASRSRPLRGPPSRAASGCGERRSVAAGAAGACSSCSSWQPLASCSSTREPARRLASTPGRPTTPYPQENRRRITCWTEAGLRGSGRRLRTSGTGARPPGRRHAGPRARRLRRRHGGRRGRPRPPSWPARHECGRSRSASLRSPDARLSRSTVQPARRELRGRLHTPGWR